MIGEESELLSSKPFGADRLMRKHLKYPIYAVFLTIASMVYEDQYCACGESRGFPFAVIRPAHRFGGGDELSYIEIILNIVFYLIVILIFSWIIGKLKDRYMNFQSK